MYLVVYDYLLYMLVITDSNNGGKLQGCCGKFNVVRICAGGTTVFFDR
jgi:hypothetical protein